MTQALDSVGHGRPPQHTRFQKGRSGNPGGKPGPRKRLKNQFDAALGEALITDRKAQDEGGEENDDEVNEGRGEEDRFVYDDGSARQLFGDRYDEFKARFERAVNANDLDALADLAADFGDARLPDDSRRGAEPRKRGGERRQARIQTYKPKFPQ